MSSGIDGTAGIQTVIGPNANTGIMSVGSVDNTYAIGTVIIAPNGKKIRYLRGSFNTGWSSTTNLPVVANS